MLFQFLNIFLDWYILKKLNHTRCTETSSAKYGLSTPKDFENDYEQIGLK